MQVLRKSCLGCGDFFSKSQNKSLKDWQMRSTFCSRSCKSRANGKNRIDYRHSEETKRKLSLSHVGKLVGNKSPFWKGGENSISSRVRKLFMYRQWREGVFKRDEYTCVLCARVGGTLNADHIIPFRHILLEETIRDIQMAIKCDKLWDISNGRTLCVDCHRQTPTWGGRVLNFKAS